MLVILEILEIIPPEENFVLVLYGTKLLTEAEIEGGVLLVGDGLSKNQTQKVSRELRWFTTRKLLPSTFPKKIGQHFVKGT